MGNTSSAEEIKLGDKIGEGSYGEVFKAVWNGKRVAAKRIRPDFFERDHDGSIRVAFSENFKKEWEILRSIDHDNIVKYYTAIVPPTPESPIIVTELLECDLAKHIRNSTTKPKVPFSDVIKIMLDVGKGLRYIHTLKEPIVHRDLASKNVLLTKTLHAKIADLGQAKAFPRGAMYATAMPGTPVYAAPETYSTRLRGSLWRRVRYTEKIDIFSFGAMLLEIIIGHLPVHRLPDPILEDGETVPEYIRRSEDLEEMGPDHPLHSLVLQCLDNIPERRPSAGKIIEELLKFSKVVDETLSSSPTGDKVGTMSHIHYDHKFKLVVLGESGVGKTSIVTRFLNANSQLSEITLPRTLQSEDHFERLRFRDKSVHLHIVDVGGHELTRASCLAPQIFRRVRGAVIAFDLLSEMSFLEVPNWVKVVREKCGEELPIVLVGNKDDELERWVDSRKVDEFARRKNLFYIESSAKSGKNIDEIFSVLVDLMIKYENQKEGESKTSDLVASLRESLSQRVTCQEKSPITERLLTLRSDALDAGVIELKEEKENKETMEQDEGDRKRKSRCCLLN